MDLRILSELGLLLGGAFLLVLVTHRLLWSLLTLLVPEKTSYFWSTMDPRARTSLLVRFFVLVPPIFLFSLAEWYLLTACQFDNGLKMGLILVAVVSVFGRYAARTREA